MNQQISEIDNTHMKILKLVDERIQSCTCIDDISDKQQDEAIDFQKWHRESGLGSFDIRQAKAMRALMSDFFNRKNFRCFDQIGYLHLFEHLREKIDQGTVIDCRRCN